MGKRPRKKAPRKARKRKPRKSTLLRRQNNAANDLRDSLKQTKFFIAKEGKGLPRYRVVKNRDLTIDGELMLANLPHGYTVETALLDLEDFLGRAGIPASYWVSVGGLTDWGTKPEFRAAYEALIEEGLSPEEAAKRARKMASPLPRYKGAGRVATYPQVAAKVAENFLTASTKIFGGRNKKRRHKPSALIVRFYWNPYGVKPRKR